MTLTGKVAKLTAHQRFPPSKVLTMLVVRTTPPMLEVKKLMLSKRKWFAVGCIARSYGLPCLISDVARPGSCFLTPTHACWGWVPRTR